MTRIHDSRLTVEPWRRVTAGIVTMMLGLMALSPAMVAGASPTACRVRNLDTDDTFRSLQGAVDVARPGDRLTVKGTCRGVMTIAKDLTISGVRTRLSGRPTLDGELRGRVVTIGIDVRVTLRDLLIRNGVSRFGGGLQSNGTLVLSDVVIRDRLPTTVAASTPRTAW